MEAMARGVPVVATRVGGVPDLVAHGQTGWLAEPGDTAAIAEGIREISTDAALRARLAENGVRAMGRYDWPGVIETLECVLRDVTSGRRQPAAQTSA
jgi:glycosyltransferase involved in cell wall biosynthesis